MDQLHEESEAGLARGSSMAWAAGIKYAPPPAGSVGGALYRLLLPYWPIPYLGIPYHSLTYLKLPYHTHKIPHHSNQNPI